MRSSAVEDVSLSNVYTVMLRRYLKALQSNTRQTHDRKPGQTPASFLERQLSLTHLKRAIEAIVRLEGNRSFGLKIGAQIHPSDFGIVGYTLMNCPDLLTALQLTAQYKPFINEGFEARIKWTGREIHYQVDNCYDLELLAPIVELDFAAALQFGKLLAGPHYQDSIRLNAVFFQHTPLAEPEEYERVFGCPVYFSQAQNRIAAPRSILDIPVHGASPALSELLQGKLQQLVDLRNPQQSLAERVTAFLSRYLGQTLPDSEKTARYFHMSLSAFKRHLALEGTSFQAIIDDLRCQQACQLIVQTQLPLKTIAHQLGYANASTFNKAFRRWRQCSPADYRKRQETSLYRMA